MERNEGVYEEQSVYGVVNSDGCTIYKRGKNYYACNNSAAVRVTINSFNCRVITADKYDRRNEWNIH